MRQSCRTGYRLCVCRSPGRLRRYQPSIDGARDSAIHTASHINSPCRLLLLTPFVLKDSIGACDISVTPRQLAAKTPSLRVISSVHVSRRLRAPALSRICSQSSASLNQPFLRSGSLHICFPLTTSRCILSLYVCASLTSALQTFHRRVHTDFLTKFHMKYQPFFSD